MEKRISNKKIYLILFFIMLVGIIWYSYGFFVEKTGTHSDEEWSYGLANSYFEPFIENTDNYKYEEENVYVKNTGEWTSGEVINDYLTVQEDERFSFDSVYYNQSCDVHPPLYYYILHFLSSFFVDQYVPALAFIINVVSYIIMSLFLYKLMLLISKSRFAGVICVLFNTFTMGTLSMMVFMRMYVMLAMFAVILVYLNAKIYYIDDCRKNLSTYIELIIITLLGALTHHYFLPFAFIITAIMCVCWLVKKEKKTLLKYAVCMLLGVGLSIVLFPATLDHVFGISTIEFSEYNGDTLIETSRFDSTDETNDFRTGIENYEWKLFIYMIKTFFQMVFNDEIGCSLINVYSSGILYYLPIVFATFITLSVVTVFLFRKEFWFINFSKKAKNKLKKIPSDVKKIFKFFNWFLFALLISVIFIILITCFAGGELGYVLKMGEYVNRYFFSLLYILYLVLYLHILYIFYAKKFLKIKKFTVQLLRWL